LHEAGQAVFNRKVGLLYADQFAYGATSVGDHDFRTLTDLFQQLAQTRLRFTNPAGQTTCFKGSCGHIHNVGSEVSFVNADGF
jgi:hypothetical protein